MSTPAYCLLVPTTRYVLHRLSLGLSYLETVCLPNILPSTSHYFSLSGTLSLSMQTSKSVVCSLIVTISLKKWSIGVFYLLTLYDFCLCFLGSSIIVWVAFLPNPANQNETRKVVPEARTRMMNWESEVEQWLVGFIGGFASTTK
jgi:hypothetical protein